VLWLNTSGQERPGLGWERSPDTSKALGCEGQEWNA